jgi:hypothetical protein
MTSQPHQDAHASDATTGPHGSMADHGEDHGDDDHAHAEEPEVRFDIPAWGAAILGVLFGLAVVIVIAIASGALR